jgi:radical SAM superfamily enzyme YgiQ (UPF0313 family)
MEPLQLGVIAGLSPPDIEIVLYDDRFEEIPYDEPTDLVAITVEAFTARRSYEICAEYRKRHIPVIIGGIHPTLIPEEARQYADSVFLGDAEYLWHEVLRDARRGQLQALYRSKAGSPQPQSFTRRDIFKDKGYLPITLLQFGRGCEFTCNFCAVSAYFNHTYYQRRIAQVVEEIERQDRKLLFFVDDNIVADHHAAKELFKALIPLNIRWVGQGSIDMTADLELMELMVKSGCLGNVIGFESVTEEGLEALDKSVNLPNFDGYQKAVTVLQDLGLQTWAAFVLGHDQETPESIEKTLEFALSNKFCFAAFNILMPYPRTLFYQRLQHENRLLYDGHWWLHPDYRFNHAAFVPKLMTPEELTERCFAIRKTWNSYGTMIKRLFNLKTNIRTLSKMGIFLRYNPLFRKETFKKQGMKLGLR